MSGRGCIITVKLLGGLNGTSDTETEELTLPVALHSPLSVLREQLHQIVSIAPTDQVLILCDLSDPDRNSDLLLVGRDHMTLNECGFQNGSILTLHALGLSAEKKQRLLIAAFAEKVNEKNPNIQVLHTDISPADADHSYNGIVFDIESRGPYEVDLVSISLGGMLGRIRVYARDRPWDADQPTAASPHWWAHQAGLSSVGWECIADENCRPSWDKPFEIKFNKTWKISPHQRKALYCHSNLPDDLGIQYQSYQDGIPFAEDQHIRLHPGLGHTGSNPFDQINGWYRSNRGLAGTLSYLIQWKGWTPFTHHHFTPSLQNAVMTMLLCQNHLNRRPSITEIQERPTVTPRLTINSLPVSVIYHILEFMHYDWFSNLDVQEEENEETMQRELSSNPSRRQPQQQGGTNRANLLGRILQYFGGHGAFQEFFVGNEPVNLEAILDDDDDDDDEEDLESMLEYDPTDMDDGRPYNRYPTDNRVVELDGEDDGEEEDGEEEEGEDDDYDEYEEEEDEEYGEDEDEEGDVAHVYKAERFQESNKEEDSSSDDVD